MIIYCCFCFLLTNLDDVKLWDFFSMNFFFIPDNFSSFSIGLIWPTILIFEWYNFRFSFFVSKYIRIYQYSCDSCLTISSGISSKNVGIWICRISELTEVSSRNRHLQMMFLNARRKSLLNRPYMPIPTIHTSIQQSATEYWWKGKRQKERKKKKMEWKKKFYIFSFLFSVCFGFEYWFDLPFIHFVIILSHFLILYLILSLILYVCLFVCLSVKT